MKETFMRLLNYVGMQTFIITIRIKVQKQERHFYQNDHLILRLWQGNDFFVIFQQNVNNFTHLEPAVYTFHFFITSTSR